MTQSDIAISARGLGKSYKIGHRAEEGRSETLRDAMVKGVSSFARKTGDVLRGRPLIAGDTIEEFWALKDVSFEIKRGEAVGIIGHNGAGKSTLLKVLSRITEPSAGQVRIAGRIASLLEVGTGFHPELSGRENIYLNGAVLGMTRAEINRKFDEIVDFAGVEKFLDTPVKRYSSGMYVRLAFSVAAHLEPEILVVDEVLAVGDAEFQKKCLGKMENVASEGRTILFVSHNMASISALCNSCIVLSEGQVQCIKKPDEAISFYHESSNSPSGGEISPLPEFKIRNAEFANSAGETINSSGADAQIELHLTIEHGEGFGGTRPAVKLVRQPDQVAFMTCAENLGLVLSDGPETLKLQLKIPVNILNCGRYSAQLRLSRPFQKTLFDEVVLAAIDITSAPATGSVRGEGSNWAGATAPAINWNILRSSES